MSFNLLAITSVYPGSLEYFYRRNSEIKSSSYEDNLNLFLNESTDFAGSYFRNFNKIGIAANYIIGNDITLLNKWKKENASMSLKNYEIFLRQLEILKPDVLWLEDINSLSKEWIELVKVRFKSIRLIIAYHCSPWNYEILNKLRCVDFVVTCTPGLKLSLEKEGIKSYLVYHGFDPDILSRLITTFRKEPKNIVFSGSLFTGGELHNARINLIDQILKANLGLELFVNLENINKIKVKQVLYFLSRLFHMLKMDGIIGRIPVLGYSTEPVKQYSERTIKSSKPPRFGIEMFELLHNSRMVLNIHLGMAGEYAGNMRLFEATGTGSCLLTDNKKNIGDLFEVGKEIVVYESTQDCIEKIKWFLDHEEERRKIAASGQMRTLSDHTVENRCRQISKIVHSELTRS